MIEAKERPNLEEAYTRAMHASDLKVREERRGDVDLIIAAGWSDYRIGGALLRLHTEFDGTAKPRLVTKEALLGPGRHDKEARKVASRAARGHNRTEMSLLLMKLRALGDVRMQMTLRLIKWRVEDAEAKGLEILLWWLAQACEDCGGTKFQAVAGTGRLSSKACETCRGSGRKDIPHDQIGRKTANWMDQCVERARRGMGEFLGSPSGRFDQVELIRGRCQDILRRTPNDEAALKILSHLPPLQSARR